MQTLGRTEAQPAPQSTPRPTRAAEWERRLRALAPYAEPALRPLRRYGEYALGGATALGMLLTIWSALLFAPREAVQGDIQRIMYFHVPMAWVAYLAFFVVFGASILYLWRKDDRWDSLARASAEIGTVFTTLVLITGMLWARGFWGVWWDGEPRLTTTLILWFIYVGYLLLRFYAGHTEGSARIAAVLGIVGFVDVPIVHFAVSWWRGVHPDQYVLKGTTPQVPGAVLLALLLALLTFTALYGFLMLQVYRLERFQDAARRLRARVDDVDDEGDSF